MYHALSCPRVHLEAATTAALHQLSQDVYSRTQAAGGLCFFRLWAIMLKYRAGLHRFATQAHSLFADIKRDSKKITSLRREVELLLRPGCLHRSRYAVGRGKKQRRRVFREPPRPALRPHKGYRHARRVQKELELDLSSFVRMPLVSM